MAIRPEDLPKDPAALVEMVLAFDGENDDLRAEIATLKGLIFGARSERTAIICAEQLALDLERAPTRRPRPTTTNRNRTRRNRSGARPKRNIGALPAHLPRVEQVIEPASTLCPCCTGQMHRIGEEMSEALDRVPAWLRVLRTIRPKYACRACEGPIVQAPAPARLVEGGMATTALIAHIAAAKYAWQSTLYRQAQILAGQGVVVDRQTLARWMGSAAWMVRGLYDLQLKTMHRFDRLFCDETPMPVLDPGAADEDLPVLGACDGRPGLEGSGAAGGRLCVRRRARQEGDRGAAVRLRGRASGRRLCRLQLARGRREDVGQDPAGVLPRSRAPQLRQGPQDDEVAVRQRRSSRASRRSTRSRSEFAASTPTSAAPSAKPRRSR